jgi:hypothetical protein
VAKNGAEEPEAERRRGGRTPWRRPGRVLSGVDSGSGGGRGGGAGVLNGPDSEGGQGGCQAG